MAAIARVFIMALHPAAVISATAGCITTMHTLVIAAAASLLLTALAWGWGWGWACYCNGHLPA